MDALKPRVVEKAVALGPRKSVVGIVTEPAAVDAAAPHPTVVLLNAGLVHRVGPCRMNVLLARELAQAGFPCLRFDLSGIGDSEPRADGLPLLEAAIADIREALDWLAATRKAERFVLFGLCAGANHALVYAGTDPRVSGMVLLDPATPRTFGWYWRHYLPRLFRPRIWIDLMRGRHPMVSGLAQRVANRQVAGPAAKVDLQSAEVREYLARAYAKAIEGRVDILAVFTSDLEDQLNYRDQLLDAFPGVAFGERLDLEYFDGVDHTFTRSRDRERLFARVRGWLQQRSPLADDPSRAA